MFVKKEPSKAKQGVEAKSTVLPTVQLKEPIIRYGRGTHLTMSDHIRATVFGGVSNMLASIWTELGYTDKSADSINTWVQVPDGKTFKLYALGQMYCTKRDSTDIRAKDSSTSTVIKALGKGVYFGEYKNPYTATGECIVIMEGWQDFGVGVRVNGYMVFSIE